MQFLTNYPALIINAPSNHGKHSRRDETSYLIISDLHIGITKRLYDKGISIPSQIKGMLDRIHELKRISGAKNLIMLGDIKDKVPGTSWQEEMEIPNFLSRLKFDKIIIVKGNHDGNIEKLIPNKKKIKVVNYFNIGNYHLTHGHRALKPSEMKTKKSETTIIIGHNQPHIQFQDDMKANYSEPVWVRGIIMNAPKKTKKRSRRNTGVRLIIMPAFNELCGATTVNKDKLLGPIAKNLDYKKTHIFLLDGTDLGKLSDFKK